ncbi:hypothetical protein FCH79_03510 [Pseudomonas koreensis]|nr:hypothetical protein [Pseudomonas koreensis]
MLDLRQGFTRDRGAAIAGKPAPTVFVLYSECVNTAKPVGAGLPAMRPSASPQKAGMKKATRRSPFLAQTRVIRIRDQRCPGSGR